MKILINQPFGLGDVIYCVTIARRWIKEGHSILWPVFPQFVEGCQRAYPDITFADWRTVHCNYELKTEHDWQGYRVVPLRWNVDILAVHYDRCMETKYTLCGWDYREWKELAGWNRVRASEDALFDKLGLEDKEYVLVNDTFSSFMNQRIKMPTDFGGRKVVEMGVIDNYSLFDWAKVIENAAEVHTVSTSLFYILEMMDLKQPLHLYPRPTDPKYKHVDYLFTKPYILHY